MYIGSPKLVSFIPIIPEKFCSSFIEELASVFIPTYTYILNVFRGFYAGFIKNLF